MSDAVLGKVVLDGVLLCGAWITYGLARLIGFTCDQALITALIAVVCTIGSWHP